jgi:hypothetical protein
MNALTSALNGVARADRSQGSSSGLISWFQQAGSWWMGWLGLGLAHGRLAAPVA